MSEHGRRAKSFSNDDLRFIGELFVQEPELFQKVWPHLTRKEQLGVIANIECIHHESIDALVDGPECEMQEAKRILQSYML